MTRRSLRIRGLSGDLAIVLVLHRLGQRCSRPFTLEQWTSMTDAVWKVTAGTLSVLRACVLGLSLAGHTAVAEELEEIVVTGQRNLLGQELYLDGDGRSVDSNDQVAMNRTIGDWIEHLPGISLNGQGGLLQGYSIRGFSRWRVRTEVDGVPVITDRPAGNSGSFLPPDLVQQAQVSHGPGSSYFGSGAMGGTVSLSTLEAEGSGLTTALQSNDGGFSTTVWTGRGEGFSGALSLRRAGFAKDANGNRLNSGYEQAALALRAEHRVRALDVTFSWLPSYGRDIGKSSASYPERQVSEYPSELHSIAQVQLEREGRWLMRLYHHFQDWSSRTERIGDRTNRTDHEAHTLGGLFYAATDFRDGIGRWGVEWVGRRGVSIRDAEYDTDGNLIVATQQVDGAEDNLAFFVSQEWKVRRLSLGAGARYDFVAQSDHDRRRSDDQLNLQAGADLALTDRWLVSAEVGTGFRFPSLTELYFNGVTPRGDTLGNPDLDAERSVGMQLRAAFSGDPLSASAVVYRNEVEGYIERYELAENLRSYRNLNRAEIQGYEFELDWRPVAGWTHRVSYQWQRGEDSDGRTLADLNPPGWRYLLAWQGDRAAVQSDVTFVQARSAYGRGEQPLAAAMIWNSRWMIGWGNGWQGELYINNILNRLYRSTADEDAAYQPGRTFGLRISWSWPSDRPAHDSALESSVSARARPFLTRTSGSFEPMGST